MARKYKREDLRIESNTTSRGYPPNECPFRIVHIPEIRGEQGQKIRDAGAPVARCESIEEAYRMLEELVNR